MNPKFEDILLFNLENINRLIHKFGSVHFVLNSSGPYFGSNWWYAPLSGYDENSENVVDPKFEDTLLFNLEDIDHLIDRLIHKFDLAHFVLNSSGPYFRSNWWYEPLSGYDENSENVVGPNSKIPYYLHLNTLAVCSKVVWICFLNWWDPCFGFHQWYAPILMILLNGRSKKLFPPKNILTVRKIDEKF